MSLHSHRRDFLKASAALAGLVPYAVRTMADETKSPNDRPRVGCIGNGGMGTGDARAVSQLRGHPGFLRRRPRARREAQETDLKADKAEIYEDYRKLLDRKDIDIVTISTPDHWHTKIAIDAVRAGKDVYCQKPMTLTIDEGKKIGEVVKESKRVFQVGTQQRSEDHNRFLTAVAMVRDRPDRQDQRKSPAPSAAVPGAARSTRPTRPKV